MSSDETNEFTGRRATDRGLLPLDRMHLIGVMGSDDAMSALIRMPSGGVVRVQPGDTLRGSAVVAIDVSGVILARAGESHRLDLPALRETNAVDYSDRPFGRPDDLMEGELPGRDRHIDDKDRGPF